MRVFSNMTSADRRPAHRVSRFRPRVQALEGRRLMAADVGTDGPGFDVNGDGDLNVGDVLAVAQAIRTVNDGGELEDPSVYDVNGDGALTPRDTLRVLNAVRTEDRRERREDRRERIVERIESVGESGVALLDTVREARADGEVSDQERSAIGELARDVAIQAGLSEEQIDAHAERRQERRESLRAIRELRESLAEDGELSREDRRELRETRRSLRRG